MGDERENAERESEGRVVAMDTPKRNQITSPVSKFEESPVFNYINNLSPIQPVKSVHITQTFNSLSFASLPSVFTSPHVSSLKESRFLRRHQSDPAKPEFSYEIGSKVHTKDCNSVDQQENFEPGSSFGEVSVEQSNECSKLLVEVDTSTPLVQEVSEKGSFGSEVHIEPIHQIEQNIEVEGCDWENLIFDATDVLDFDSPSNDTEPLKGPNEEPVEPGMSFCTILANDFPQTQPVGAVGSSETIDTDNLSTQPGETGGLQETVENQDIFACISLENCMGTETSEKMDDEVATSLDRGKRRRCLVFEMVGARRKHFNDGPSSSSASNDKHIVPFKPANGPSRRILPGIGLHLNSLATSVDQQKVVKHETLASGGLIISVPRSTPSLHSLNIGQEPSNKFMVASSLERETASAENQVTILEDASQASGYVANEELNQSSPRKKRRKSDHGGESEACKRCNCKKSKCLKLYCECFAAGVYCVEPCSCQDCFNKPIHEDTVLATRKQIESRNPLAFAPKVIRTSDSILETGDESIKNTPASARHKRGCNCKKSGCLKKYCECYQGGVGCSINCRCEGCKNAFGRKDGSTDAELEEEEEIDECERAVVDRALPKNTINVDVEHNTDFSIPATPLQFGRPSIPLPFSSKSKPPRSGLATGSSSSSGLYSSRILGKQALVQLQPKFDKPFQTVQSDEMPEILQGKESPVTGVKSSSPNSKRVSPPHCGNDSASPSQRSSRKLILRSIPSFPSLTDPKH